MMRRTGAVSAFLLSLSCAACASYPGFGSHGFSIDSAYAPPKDAKALGDYLLDQAFNLNILSAPTLSVSTTNLKGAEYTTTGYIVFNHASGG